MTTLGDRLESRRHPPAGPLDHYHDDPVAFATELVVWPEHESLADYQADGLRRLVERRRLALRGPHGLGKTTGAALAILWFSLTREAAGEDWKIPTTASAWLQLTRFLWPEVHLWSRRLRWDRIGRQPFLEGRELLDLSIKLRHGEAFSASPAEPAKLEGAHARQLLYVFDEAKSIPAEIFDAAEGAFAGAGPDTHAEAYALAISTPGEPLGRFYEICTAKPGLEHWDRRHVTRSDAIGAGRMSAEWAASMERQHGESSAIYQNRVEGNFAASDEVTVIPLSWVEAAQMRWVERYGERGESWSAPSELEAFGVDVSDTGGDQTVFASRYGDVLGPIERGVHAASKESGAAVMATAGRIVSRLGDNRRATAVVDAIGIGSGVVGRAREQLGGGRVDAFIAGARTDRTDRSGELHFADKRSAAWWNMRDRLDPTHGDGVALPPDDMLVGDLVAPHWFEMSNGRVKVESKDDIRKRLGRSTDTGDAVVQAFWVEHGAVETEVPTGRMPSLNLAQERQRSGSMALRGGLRR